MTAKYKKHVQIVVLVTKPIAFLMFSSPSPSSDLKVPKMLYKVALTFKSVDRIPNGRY